MNDWRNEPMSSFRKTDTVESVCSNNSLAQDRWAVILAGGDGSRLLPLTREISGDERPKQFCKVLGNSTLLDETRRRVELAISPLKTMFVLTEKHKCYYEQALRDVPSQNLTIQPKNIGTTPAILYSLLRLEQINPTASVAFFPSDHYFSDNKVFMSYVENAFGSLHTHSDSIILLGVEPDKPDEEYGWIETDSAISKSNNFFSVRRFWEKPNPELAQKLMTRGCLWNSFVMVGKVEAFLKIIRSSATELYRNFAAIKSKIHTSEETTAIRMLYERVPDSNFSKEVLTVMAKSLNVIPIRGSKWSDLGSPQRVFSTLSENGMTTSLAQIKVMSSNFAGGNI